MKIRRSTASLTLVLIGAAVLPACGSDEEPAARDVYRTRTDCQRDWGDDPKKCEPQSSGSHAGYFLGPMMYGMGRSSASSNATAPRTGSHAVGSTTVSRGGFGSSAAAHGAGS